MPAKPVIAFVTGGYSSEAVISYQSAATIEKNIDTDKFDVYKIDIRPEGWVYEYENGKVQVDKDDFSLLVHDKKIWFDAVLIGIHGTPGEDGKLQGYLDLHKIPYTSCDAATSALTMNKRYTVAVASFGGIATAKSVHLFDDNKIPATEIASQLKFPVFVKPNSGGSSIGMSKVNEPKDLQAAIDKAFKEDTQVLIEEFISGREFTVGVFKSSAGITVLPITEVRSLNEFFDYEAKYKGKNVETTPADIPEALANTIRATAKKVFQIFNCRGVVRMDFIYNEEAGKPYLLEINTVPGQSEASIVPQQVRAMGGTLKDFYTALIEDALSRKLK
ncbi:MAG: D-alanine--D-alanine ligase [Chitinophagaceae bacterium]|nr:D-alanine--D-alanine ligase [Chitinophagaceae bacterium]